MSSDSSISGTGTSEDANLSAQRSLLVLNGFLVFCMQAGFVVYETGHGRAKNVRNICLKNVLSVLLSALAWWAIGYAFSYGRSAGGVIGTSHFFTNGDDSDNPYKPWFFTWIFALSTSTIVSGCLAERTQLATYPAVTLLITVLIHPVAAHWSWNKSSWLQAICHCNFLDFAGGTAVHAIGGLVGLIGAATCGPRIGRFEDGQAVDIPGHDMSSVSMGTFLMWFGWLGFNGGTLYLYNSPLQAGGLSINRVAMNVTLAASAGGLTALVIKDLRRGVMDLRTCCNGLLSGLVVASAVAGFVTPWAACVSGALAGAVYTGTSYLLVRLGIDDPLDSSAVHLGSGVLGTLMLGLLARPQYVSGLTGTTCGGAFYRAEHAGLQIGMQFLGVATILAWTAVLTTPLYLLLRRFELLRVDQLTELAGIDNMEHGGPAYPEFMARAGSDRGVGASC